MAYKIFLVWKMFLISPTTSDFLASGYDTDVNNYGDFPPYLEMSLLTKEKIEHGLKKGEVVPVNDDEYRIAISRLAALCYEYGSYQYDPSIAAEAFRLLLSGSIPVVTGESKSYSQFIEENLLDFSAMLLGYIMQIQTFESAINIQKIKSETRVQYIKSKVLVFDSIVLKLKEILIDNKRPQDNKNFVIGIFKSLGNLALYNSLTYQHNLTDLETVPLEAGISSGMYTSYHLSEIYLRMASLLEYQHVAGTRIKDTHDEITAPVLD